MQSTNAEFNRAVIRVNVHRGVGDEHDSAGSALLHRRQTVQYLNPTDVARSGTAMLQLAELVCIDEAAAIPLPIIKLFLGPYLLFMSSTINGYGYIIPVILNGKAVINFLVSILNS